MKQLSPFIACIFISTLSAFGQTPPSTWDTLPWKNYADFKLQLLNKSHVTTGVLYDRVLPIAQLEEHPGLPSTNSDMTSPDHLLQAYFENIQQFL